ncbi:lysine-rich arabinogalactan protein 19-like [Miscanthus floridulus]|uniref:lysine-rich arabinogalactan protein 19-like n=1 Tax=Miscanthus floridulus TaxID=154761 RepID=UPI003458A781
MASPAASTSSPSPAISAAPFSTTAPSATSGVRVTPSLPLGSVAASAPVFSPEQTTAAIVDLSHCMREVQETLRTLLQGQLTITSPLPTQPPPSPPPPSSATSYPAIS